MKLEQHITLKVIDGIDVFRVVDKLNGQTLNVRGVRKIGDEYQVISNLSEDEFEFLNGDKDGMVYMGKSRKGIIEELRNHEQVTAKNLMVVLDLTSGLDMARTEVRLIAGYVYATTYIKGSPNVPQIQFAIGDSEGKLSYQGPVLNDEMVLNAIILGLYNNPLPGDDKEQFIQINQSEYLMFVKEDDVTIVIPAFLQEEKEGRLSWSSNLDYIRYIEHENKEATVSNESTYAFEDDKEANVFLSKQAEKLTELLTTTGL